jgi:hypothetical protein
MFFLETLCVLVCARHVWLDTFFLGSLEFYTDTIKWVKGDKKKTKKKKEKKENKKNVQEKKKKTQKWRTIINKDTKEQNYN